MTITKPILQFHRFDQLGSTNAKAKELAAAGAPHGTVVITKEQTSGRGRLGRTFFSPKDSGIYLSMILRPEVIGANNESAVLLTTAASVAVARAVKRTLDLDLQIKWVNDLYYNDKKVCGILAESSFDPACGSISAVVIGIGLNYQAPPGGFPEELREIAGALFPADTALSAAASTNVDNLPDTDTLTVAIAEELFILADHITDRTFLTEYKARSMVLGRRVRILPKLGGESQVVEAIDIADDGGLVIRHDDGTVETLTTGEISLRIV